MRRLTVGMLSIFVIFAVTARADVERTHTAPGLGNYDVPFWANGTYRDDVKSPSNFLGYELGSKPVSPPEILAYFEYLSENFPNATLHDYAKSYEGRRLVYLVVTSEENAARLDAIRADQRKLSDPRLISGRDEARRIIKSVPAMAWMGYAIHGDEMSSSDAAIELAYQLLAGTDETTRAIVDNIVVAIDPLQNPDGRTRWLAQMESWNAVVPSRDIQSLSHRGFWPYGRTNHYLFDLNRDWFAQVHPESRGRVSAMVDWMPHYVLDCHEMGPTETYLFSPPREPFNPHMTNYIRKWWDRCAEYHAASFDNYGWAYYTREWNEEFFPGYGSSWGVYLGAVGMLFEQAGVDGSQVKRPEGTVMTYRESVHHSFIGSMAQLHAVAEGREELLGDYYNMKLENVRSAEGAYLFPPIDDETRMDRFATRLARQHIEVSVATQSFRVGRTSSARGDGPRNQSFPAGTIVVRTNQPVKQLIDVILTPDVRIPTSFLKTEKKEILKKNGSKLYDTTGWSVPLAYGLEAWYTDDLPHVQTADYEPAERTGSISNPNTTIGFAFDAGDESAYHLLARLFERGIEVRSSRQPFDTGERVMRRGSFQVRLSDNPGLNVDDLEALAGENGVDVFGISAGLNRGPNADLGGEDFALLEAPRVAIVGGSPVSSYDFGAMWHLLDSRFQVRCSTLDVGTLASIDLRKYNVIILPHASGGSSGYERMLGKSGVRTLKDWVGDGGTLIAEGGGAAFVADTSTAISSVRTRRQSLKKLALYQAALAEAREAENPDVDSLAIWEGIVSSDEDKTDKENTPGYETLKAEDEKARRLFPRGAILDVDLDMEHWLATGCSPKTPVMFNSSYAYMARGSVEVAARLSDAKHIRLSGLLWNEARERWANTAWATREGVGNGQVILFATLPDFRGYFYGAERLLLNAIFLGPGFGARQSIGW